MTKVFKGWLIYFKEDAEKNREYINWYLSECHKHNLDLQLIYKENLSFGIENNRLSILYECKQVLLPHFSIVRAIDPMLSKQLEQLGVEVFNSSLVSEICNNKALTHQYLAAHHIPMLDTLFYSIDILKNSPSINIPYNFPFIIKEVSGRGGKQVYYINHADDFQQTVKNIHSSQIIVQKVATHKGKDLRVFVIGNKVIAAVLRESSTGDFKANYTLGGTAKLYHLSKAQLDDIHKIIRLFNFDFVGLDFFFDDDGSLLLNEVEDIVGSRSLSATTDINIVDLYLEHISNKLKTNNS
jgi:gamma-F420-2:alpha-L-glutamate ligase